MQGLRVLTNKTGLDIAQSTVSVGGAVTDIIQMVSALSSDVRYFWTNNFVTNPSDGQYADALPRAQDRSNSLPSITLQERNACEVKTNDPQE